MGDFKSLTEREYYLNNYYSDNYSVDEVMDLFNYLTSKDSKIKTTRHQIWKMYYKRKIGTMLRRLDIERFKSF